MRQENYLICVYFHHFCDIHVRFHKRDSNKVRGMFIHSCDNEKNLFFFGRNDSYSKISGFKNKNLKWRLKVRYQKVFGPFIASVQNISDKRSWGEIGKISLRRRAIFDGL